MADLLTPDVCVVGGGPGGIAAALAAVAGGLSVCLVERGTFGGSDLVSGTIPSKALVSAANLYESLRLGPAMGVSAAPLQVNLAKVREHIDAVTLVIAPNYTPERLAALGVNVIQAVARFTSRTTLLAGETSIRPRHTILAVGAIPALPAIPGLESVECVTPRTGLFDLARKPAHLLVLGAGPYALEFAQASNRLGIDATILSDGPALPGVDPELAGIVVTRLRAEGIRVRTNLKIASVVRRKGGVRFFVEEPEAEKEDGGGFTVDGTHVAAIDGRVPDVGELGLAAAGVATDASGIVVDRRFRTANPAIYAIGDAVAGRASAARAEAQAVGVVRAIASRLGAGGRVGEAPEVAYTDPGLATVGANEAEARARGEDIRVFRASFVDNACAQIERAPHGLLKVITTPGGRVLGAGLACRDAAELIAPWSLAVANRLPLAAMADCWPANPSRSAVARRLALLPEARLTPSLGERIMGMLGKSG